MKFRRNKIKREHSILKGALDWLEDLSKNEEVTDIIPGVIDVSHSKERGITYQYETSTGCKLLLKNGGSIQEAFVVTKNPQFVKDWVAKIMEEQDLLEAALDDPGLFLTKSIMEDAEKSKKNKFFKPVQALKHNEKPVSGNLLYTRDNLLGGITEDYQLVEINQGLRDSFVESLASMADLEGPQIQDSLDPLLKNELESLQKKLKTNL
jgi:hypothetical protein